MSPTLKGVTHWSRTLFAIGLAFAFVVSLLSPAFAAGGQNGNLNGTIVDAQAGTPVVGAKITAASPSATYVATTDAHGQFSFLGMIVDTYTLSVEAKGYDAVSQSGITIIGDQNLNLGTVKLAKQLRQIGQVRVRSIASAFQPNQTVDSVTVNAGRIVQSTGKANSTDERALLLSVPGATETDTGNITIRGGLRTEVGYQFDGIPFTEPFFSVNGSNNRFSGLSQVQVVEGAGDATQGNVGGGVVNLIPKRGTNPPFGTIDAEIGAPSAYHQGAFEYGIASANGRISNYLSYTQNRSSFYYGQPTMNSQSYGNYNANAYVDNSDLIDNFIFKFGHNNSQSLQILYENRNLTDFGPYGGLYGYGSANPTTYFQYDPYSYARLGLDGEVGGAQNLQSILPTLPGQNQVESGITSGTRITGFAPTQLLKFEYDSNITPTSFLDLKLYNANFVQGNDFEYGVQGSTNPGWQDTGGRRSGLIMDFIHQFGPNYTLTFNTQLENQHPVWDGYYPYQLAQLMVTGQYGPGPGPAAPATIGNAGTNAPSLADFLPLLPNGLCPVAGGCYLSNFFPNNQIPKLPISGVNYNGTLYQEFGFGLRNQINVGQKTKIDAGVRYEGADYKYGPNPYNSSPYDVNNPSDVPPSAIGNKVVAPREIEPRLAVSYQFGRDDSIRAGYGRSTTFLNAQTSGTPGGLYNAQALFKVPALDSAAGPSCGSGTNALGPGGSSLLYKCPNYAQQLYWLYDQNFDAPDLGFATPQVANNYDLTYQHQFANGVGFRLTPFYKLSTALPSFALISAKTDPVTGAILSEVFTANNQGINRTTGLEFGLTTPERPTGFDGFLTMTYQNVLASAPPLINGEDSLPIITSGSLALGNVYRAGYVSPFVARVGGEYKTKNGFRFNPVIQYDRGYPFNVGNTIASRSPLGFAGGFINIPQVNFGAGRTTIPGFEGATGAALATNFVDAAFPGNAVNPNIAATRGTPESASAGGVLFHPDVTATMTVEYKTGRNTLGIQARNLFGNIYNGVIPVVNPYYQPVSTGVAGPQTNQPKQANPNFGGGLYVDRGFSNIPNDASAFSNAAYLLPPSNPTTFVFYYQLAL
jgi:hypothetical protein